jgi:cytochrome c-type biogenesis protein CcmE
MTRRLRLQIGTVVILAALVYLGIMAAHNFSQYFVPVSQYRSQYASFAHKTLRVQGRLLASTVHYDPATEVLTFVLASGHARLAVRYVGSMPSEEFANANAIVEGSMGQHGVFMAKQLLIQCPDHIQAVPSGTKTS